MARTGGGAEPRADASRAGSGDLKTKLRQLKETYEQGLITREEYEAKRRAFLEELGVEVIRFENRIVYQNIEAVLETIREAIKRRSREQGIAEIQAG